MYFMITELPTTSWNIVGANEAKLKIANATELTIIVTGHGREVLITNDLSLIEGFGLGNLN
jgi:hypothetical protein